MGEYHYLKQQVDAMYRRARVGLDRCDNVTAALDGSGVTRMTAWKIQNGHRCTIDKLLTVIRALDEAGVDMNDND